MPRKRGREGQRGVSKGPYKPRETTTAVLDAARRRRPCDSFLRSEQRKRAAARVRSAERHARPRIVDDPDITRYRVERLAARDRQASLIAEARRELDAQIAREQQRRKGGRPKSCHGVRGAR